MSALEDHPLRYKLVNELHARPFPAVEVPCDAVFLAIKLPGSAAARDRDLDRAHLLELLDRFAEAHPPPGATHHTCNLGRNRLKWENHTEFVTFTVFSPGLSERPFDPELFDVFPQDWLAEASGARITSLMIRIERMPRTEEDVARRVSEWLVPESIASSKVLDGIGTIATDFRIDAAGHMRMAVFVGPEAGPRRVGRLVQRLSEIEIYKTMSMLGLARARAMSERMEELDKKLTSVVSAMNAGQALPEDTLRDLLGISVALEDLLVQSAFRFAATSAYEAIVHQRIEMLREERIHGRQTVQEFMMRRFDPAMRTVKAAEARLKSLSERAMRTGSLLSTRVDVDRSAQNQRLLESMDRRADLQLRLQHTVEGFSVVAISYYGVNLLLNVATPIGEEFGISRGALAVGLTPLVVLLVWALVRRVRKSLTQAPRGH